ncbi:hypothetical protein M433DRAFT_155901 [Acidomyces richmondensis BFW]|nr:MAG: hypothetical protein FE78DRAFT_92649 [Acidomyces sp. 'richmondensis']KYG44166.1 hypothetical protein M433DRAFT_155901 [Acidomyces richmondensis BFW]
MSSYLWKAYYEDDVVTFRRLLAEATTYNAKAHAGRNGGATAVIGSPGTLGSSPIAPYKTRKGVSTAPSSGVRGLTLTKADVNWRDNAGLTLLHHSASSTTGNAAAFAIALIEHPLIDLYVQDAENGWTALHRAFYFGNINLARLMLERDAGDAIGKTTGHVHQTIGLIKVKDKEGNGPLDLYNTTIKDRTLRPEGPSRQRSGSGGSDEERPQISGDGEYRGKTNEIPAANVHGDQLFTFGSNQNVSLGFGDEDNRQFPERIHIRRPEHLIRRFYQEHLDEQNRKWSSHDPHYQPKAPVSSAGWLDDLPFVILSRPLIIQDVHMSKFSTAVITSDPESNLYMCGHGQGGRLGTGDEQTRYNFVCIEGGPLAGKRVATVALGQNHTLALTVEGDIFSWGNNGYGQLGYSLAKSPTSDEDPISTVPRQIFGNLKRETVVGVAASRIHSVAYTSTSLFTFGKNEGQLGIMDSDARSLEIQNTPRKVAASLFTSSIHSVAAIDKATVCLLDNHEVWVFANYGYAKVQYPLDSFQNHFLQQSFFITTYDNAPNVLVKLTGGGDTVCAMSSKGEIYTMSINQRQDNQASASTTNPAKIRGAITQPQRIWSPKKSSMIARDVGVDADGSIILSTEEGSVWKRSKRTKIKDASASGTGEYKPKDYKFSRIPGLTRVLAVRASAHGAYAAIRRDCNVLQTQIVVEEPSLRKDLWPLLCLKQLIDGCGPFLEEDRPRFWQATQKPDEVQVLKQVILNSKDIEADVANLTARCLSDVSAKYDAVLSTSTSDIRIPVHRFMLAGRSRVLRRGFRDLCPTSTFTIPDLAICEIDSTGCTIIRFSGLDILTIIDLALYLYTDEVVDFWQMTRFAPKMAFRYRQIRIELMKVASKLELLKLEPAVRQMFTPRPCLETDLEIAFADPAFFFDGDVVVQLEDEKIRVHSALVRARCPFFGGLFMGRAGGRWLAGRNEDEEVSVDMSHINSKTFLLVLRHIYADSGTELADEIVSAGLDEFIDSIIDILSVANELMLDRLSQICQVVIGKHVNARNVCELLNAIAPSSVREFKDAALEYLCLNLEAMLQGHHLNALDEDLLAELDDVIRENQLNCMPFAKSQRAEALLHERHPELTSLIDRNRQRKIDTITLRTRHQNMETFIPGSFGEEMAPPNQQKARRKSSIAASRSDIDKSALKGKASVKDMMFVMDEVGNHGPVRGEQSPSIKPMSSPHGIDAMASSPSQEIWYDARGKVIDSPKLAAQTQISTPNGVSPHTPKSPCMGSRTPPSAGAPWTISPLPGRTADMKDIMAQASASRTSSLSQGLCAAQPGLLVNQSSFSLGPPKLSQKERKRIQQAQHTKTPLPGNTGLSSSANSPKPANPWQTATSVKHIRSDGTNGQGAPMEKLNSSTPHLTMRQTVANVKQMKSQKPGACQISQPVSVSGARNASIHETVRSENVRLSKSGPQSVQASNSRPIPQPSRLQPLAEPILGLQIEEIVAQEQAAKSEIKAAVAKRDLQDIQAEQEFQEWWDKESAKVQEAERRAIAAAVKASRRRPGRGTGRGGKGGRGKVCEAEQSKSKSS